MIAHESHIQSIPLQDLLIDLNNPRYDPRINQREALSSIAREQGKKLISLAEDIVDKGLNPSELPMVTPSGDGKTFIVLEGNRRIAALKLMASPSLVTSIGLHSIVVRRYKAFHEEFIDKIPQRIDCAVLTREEASHWIFIRHTGENQGVGVVPWDGIQTHRFRGASPALQTVELVKASAYLDEITRGKLAKIAITNIERILGTPEARKYLGVDVKSGRLSLIAPEEEAIARLALVVSDIANRNVRVTHLDSRDQRVSYAKEVASRPLPKPASKSGSVTISGQRSTAHSGVSGHRISPERTFLIPSRFKIAISQTRINKIYHELQTLKVDKFVNCCAVMFRVFIELSVDDFAHRHRISLKTIAKQKQSVAKNFQAPIRDMTFRQKLETIADHLDVNKICTKDELRGVRTLIANRNHVLSIDSLNAYVHNKNYNPTSSDLKTTWDNVQVFVERLWTN